MTAPRADGAARAGGAAGYLEVLGATVLWGSSGIFSVALFRRGMSPEDVALLRPAAGAVFLALLAFLVRPGALRPGRRGLAFMAGVGGLATAVFQLAYQRSTEAVGVPTTVALLYLAPVFVLAASGPLLREPPSGGRLLLGGVSVVGVWLTVLGAGGVDVEITVGGVLWGGLAGLSYAGYTVFGRRSTPRHGAVATALWSTAGGCAFLLAAAPFQTRSPSLSHDPGTWGLLVVYGFLTIAVATFLFYDALGRIEASRAAIAATLEPVVAALLAGWLLGQTLTPGGWVGLGLVVAGVAGAYASRGADRDPAAGTDGGVTSGGAGGP